MPGFPHRQLARAAAGAAGLAAILALAGVGLAPAAEAQDPLAAGASAHQSMSQVYSADGVRYEAIAGRLDDLFPTASAGSSVAGNAPALAVDVVPPEGAPRRLLVPGTEGEEQEVQPSLVYEEATSTLFVLWLAQGSNGRSHLLLDAMADEQWGHRVSVTREAMVIERPPSIVLTRDSPLRTVLHVAWSAEERAGVRTFYSPVVLFHGEYAGWNPRLELGLLDSHPAAAASPPPGTVYRAGGVSDGVDLRSVVLAFANDTTGHLLTARSRVLPMGLVAFSDEARNHLIGVGGTWRRTARELADDVADHLGGLAQEVHVGARAYLARAARAFVLENAGVIATIEELGDALRRHLLEAGASLLGQEFETAPQTCGLVEVGPDDADQTEPAVHVFEVCRIRDRALPEIGEEEVTIRASRDGGLVLLTWRENDVVRFRLSEGSGWTEPRSIEPGGDVDLLWKSLGR
ncbi:MAG TPA: hypothetical protein VMS86_08055 [Thermoanaerobaculia bacterium]|nr:hypothetical protein [Thermoanaerobaculia bacterium]